jgi:arylsulfatase A-like enzyme
MGGSGAGAPAAVHLAGERPHVILIVLESTRGDVIGRRIGGHPVAPNLEALAAGGTLVRNAYSHVGFTTESMQTLFTGRIAPRDGTGSLFEIFQSNGYRMGVFSGQAEDFGDIAATVRMRRADVFVDAQELREERVYGAASPSSLKLDGRTLIREFDRHFGRAEMWRRPNFLYFNFQSAHFPYRFPAMPRILPGEPVERSEIAAGNRERVAATYWNAVAYNDRLIGQVVDRLRRLGVWEKSIVVITGDHGESLFDDGFLGHGHMINRQQTHIPFVLSRPVAVEGPVGLADMRGIILRAAGAELPGRTPGNGGRVFQYIGSLDRPSSIGFAFGDRWTIFSFDREALWTSRSGAWQRYVDLEPASAARAEADKLIREWGRQRWLHHIGR